MITEFRAYFAENRPLLKLWGDTVVEQIKSELAKKEVDLSVFLKIPVNECRVKQESSALGKIARKGYTNPKEQMEDLVGARFVVLLTDDLNVLVDIITSNPNWTASRDNDYVAKIDENPEMFDYQSIHFILRSLATDLTSGLGVPPDLPCEVQIRTLLQHAYAELTHDNIYKPTAPKIPTKARRLVARSMALMESTDELFCRTLEEIKKVTKVRDDVHQALNHLYEKVIGTNENIDTQFNIEFLDVYSDRFSNALVSEIATMVEAKPVIVERIKERSGTLYLFQQPVILFVYWLVQNHDRVTSKTWLFESMRSDLDKVFSDFGISQSRHK